MASSWGASFGSAWGGAWGGIVVAQPSGGYTKDTRTYVVPAGRRRTEEDVRIGRVALGIIEDVAARQAETTGLDQFQQREELLAELRLSGIEAKSEYFTKLAEKREELINFELKQHFATMRENDDVLALLMLAAL